MSIKSKVLAAAAVLTLAGGLSAAGTVAASAATPQCGSGCLRSTARSTPRRRPGLRGDRAPGDPAARRADEVSPASGSNPAEDLIVPAGDPVPVSTSTPRAWCRPRSTAHYGTEPAVQIEYAPYGKPTGLCSAVAVTAYQDEALSLQPCSTPGTTVWIMDVNDSPATSGRLLPDRQRVEHRLHPPVRDDHPGEPGSPAVHADHHAAPDRQPRQRARQRAVGHRLRARSERSSGGAAPAWGRRHRPEGPTPSRKASSVSTTNPDQTEPRRSSCLSRSRTRRARLRSGRSRSPKSPRRNSRHCGSASRLPAGPAGNSSPTGRRACSWRRSRNLRAIGRRITTGASARRS